MSCRFSSILFLAGYAGVANANIAYEYIDLEASFGGPVYSITDISESGFILVNGTTLYDLVTKRKVPLPKPGGVFKITEAFLNDSNFIAGTASEYPFGSAVKGVYLKPSQPYSLITLGSLPNARRTAAYSLNNHQEIVGMSSFGVSRDQTRPMWFKYNPETDSHTPTILYDGFAVAMSINDSNQVVGFSSLENTSIDLPAFFDGQGGRELLQLPLGYASGRCTKIAPSGAIVGYTLGDTYPGIRPLLWRSRGANPEILQTPFGIPEESHLTDILSEDLIAGIGGEDGGWWKEPLLWKEGTPYRLHHFVKNFPGPRFQIDSDLQLSRDGTIIGTGSETYTQGGQRDRGFLLVPTTRPAQTTTTGKFSLPDWAAWKSPGNFKFRIIPQFGEEETIEVPISRDGSYSFTTSIFGSALFEITPPPPHLPQRFVAGVNGMDLEAAFYSGDTNGDQSVDLLDYFALSDSYLLGFGDSNFDPSADLNGDGSVDTTDLKILQARYGMVAEF